MDPELEAELKFYRESELFDADAHERLLERATKLKKDNSKDALAIFRELAMCIDTVPMATDSERVNVFFKASELGERLRTCLQMSVFRARRRDIKLIMVM